VDNDPACDVDPTPGQCAVPISVRLNVVDPNNPECSPTDLDGYLVQNYQPDTNPRHHFGLAALEQEVSSKLPLTAADTDVLSNAVNLGLLLRVAPFLRSDGTGDARWAAKRLRVRARVDSLGAPFDVDSRRVRCVPDGVSSPCDGVTGTFDQIQKHVFSRTCAVPTCHTAAVGEHQLSLLPIDSFASLVGIQPANGAANDAGKLRVDPGDPGNSFLLDKLKGDLAANEGVRMPFGLRRIHGLFIRLIEDWIVAGAPQAGFVSTRGCPAP
jgi:hypothetical protein